MELELEDGTVLEVPDGMDPDRAYFEYKVQQRKAANPKEYGNQPVLDQIKATVHMRGAGTGTAEGGGNRQMEMADPSTSNFLAGVGSGMVRTGRGLTNLVLPDAITPDWASDEAIRQQDAQDEELPGIGKFLGSTVASLPLSLGIGKGLEVASKVLGVLGRPLARSLAEGGAAGAIYGDPEHQGEGAVAGALVGGALHGGLAGAGKLMDGVVAKSEPAKALEQLAQQHGEEIFVPISQAASEDGLVNRLIKSFYREALPIVPGARGQLSRQGDEAGKKLREIALREGLPPGEQLPQNATEDILGTTKQIQQMFDKAYDDTIKSYAFNIPQDFDKQVGAAFRAKAGPKTEVNSESMARVKTDVMDILAKFGNGKRTLDGANLLNAKREISRLISAAPGHEKAGYQAADELLDKLVESELKVGNVPQNLADLKRYQELTPAYRAFRPVSQAAKGNKAKKGQFLFRTLAEKSGNSPEQLDLGQIGSEVLDKSPVTSGITGKILAGIGTGGAGYGAFMDPATTTSAIIGGNVLASRPAQRVLLGDTKFQKLLADVLRRNPKIAAQIQASLEQGTVSQTVGDGNE